MSEMREQARSTPTADAPQHAGRAAPPGPTGWEGWVLFGAMMMVLLGAFQAITGLVALFDDGYYLVAPTAWWSTPTTPCGAGSTWPSGWLPSWRASGSSRAPRGPASSASGWPGPARSSTSPFSRLPVLGVTMIVLDVLIIYAIATHGGELHDQA